MILHNVLMTQSSFGYVKNVGSLLKDCKIHKICKCGIGICYILPCNDFWVFVWCFSVKLLNVRKLGY